MSVYMCRVTVLKIIIKEFCSNSTIVGDAYVIGCLDFMAHHIKKRKKKGESSYSKAPLLNRCTLEWGKPCLRIVVEISKLLYFVYDAYSR